MNVIQCFFNAIQGFIKFFEMISRVISGLNKFILSFNLNLSYSYNFFKSIFTIFYSIFNVISRIIDGILRIFYPINRAYNFVINLSISITTFPVRFIAQIRPRPETLMKTFFVSVLCFTIILIVFYLILNQEQISSITNWLQKQFELIFPVKLIF